MLASRLATRLSAIWAAETILSPPSSTAFCTHHTEKTALMRNSRLNSQLGCNGCGRCHFTSSEIGVWYIWSIIAVIVQSSHHTHCLTKKAQSTHKFLLQLNTETHWEMLSSNCHFCIYNLPYQQQVHIWYWLYRLYLPFRKPSMAMAAVHLCFERKAVLLLPSHLHVSVVTVILFTVAKLCA